MALDWRAIRTELAVIRRRPDAQVEAGARLFRALGGKDDAGLEARLRRSEGGRRLLCERPDLMAALQDREALRRLPDGSVGREYLRFAEREKIFPEGLQTLMARVEGDPQEGAPAFLSARGRALHDLLHLVTGYGRDPAGEVALLAFTAVQNGSRPLDWLSLLGCAKALAGGRLDVWRLRRHGRSRARRAPWMFEQDWLALLPLPLDEVRRRLGLWPPPRYRSWGGAEPGA